MVTTVAAGDEEAAPFKVRNGLHQGCSYVPHPNISYFGF